MDNFQLAFIRKNLHLLVRLTSCTTGLLVHLKSKNLLTDEEVQKIELRGTSYDKSRRLYEILQTKTGAYTILIESLESVKQSGAVQVLEKIGAELHQADDYIKPELKTFGQARKPVENFTGRAKEIDDIKMKIATGKGMQHKTGPFILTIQGFGGIGKTELVRAYIESPSNRYNNLVWINGESIETVRSSFYTIGKDDLNLCTKKANGEEKILTVFMREFYEMFVDSETAFVFDNLNYIKEDERIIYFPREYYKSHQYKNAVVIITSRDQYWEKLGPKELKNLDMYNLNPLTPDDAVELVKTGLRLKEDEFKEQKANIESMVSLMGYIPISIASAISYINNQSQVQVTVYNTENFCEEYKNCLVKKSKVLKYIENCEISLLATIRMTLNEISKSQCGRFAIEIIYILAFLSRENIEVPMLHRIPRKRSLFRHPPNITNALELLVRFSLVKLDKNKHSLSILGAIQEIIQFRLYAKGKVKSVLENVHEFLEMVNDSNFNYVLEHKMAVWNHLMNLPYSIMQIFIKSPYKTARELCMKPMYLDAASFTKKSIDYLQNTCIDTKAIRDTIQRLKYEYAFTLYQLGEYVEAKTNCESLIKELGSENTLMMLKSKSLCARISRAMNDFEGAKIQFEQIYEETKRLYGSDSIKTADALFSVACAHSDLDDNGNAESLYRQVLKIYDKKLGEDNERSILVLQNIANIHGKMGKPNDALDILNQLHNKIKNSGSPIQLISTIEFNLALNLYKLNDGESFKDAHKYCDATMKNFVNIYGKAHQYTIEAIKLRDKISEKCRDIEFCNETNES